MDGVLRDFVKQFAGVAATAFLAVVLVAFVSIPASLGRQPGHARTPELPAGWHLS
jgi:hypothetical protein